MLKTRNIPYSTRMKMHVLHKEGCRNLQIATRWGCMHTTARMIITILQQSDSLNGKPRSGRLRCRRASDDRVLLCLCLTDTHKTALELKRQWSEQSGVQLTTINVRGRLLNHGFNSCIGRKSHWQRGKKKSETSGGWIQHQWTIANWVKILLSD